MNKKNGYFDTPTTSKMQKEKPFCCFLIGAKFPVEKSFADKKKKKSFHSESKSQGPSKIFNILKNITRHSTPLHTHTHTQIKSSNLFLCNNIVFFILFNLTL